MDLSAGRPVGALSNTLPAQATARGGTGGVPRDQIPAFVDARTEKWRKLIQDAGLTPQ